MCRENKVEPTSNAMIIKAVKIGAWACFLTFALNLKEKRCGLSTNTVQLFSTLIKPIKTKCRENL